MPGTTAAWENDELTVWGDGQALARRIAAHYFDPRPGGRWRCALCGREVGTRSAQLAARAREIAASPRFAELYPGARPEHLLRPTLRNVSDPQRWALSNRFRGHRCPVYRLRVHGTRGGRGRAAQQRRRPLRNSQR